MNILFNYSFLISTCRFHAFVTKINSEVPQKVSSFDLSSALSIRRLMIAIFCQNVSKATILERNQKKGDFSPILRTTFVENKFFVNPKADSFSFVVLSLSPNFTFQYNFFKVFYCFKKFSLFNLNIAQRWQLFHF